MSEEINVARIFCHLIMKKHSDKPLDVIIKLMNDVLDSNEAPEDVREEVLKLVKEEYNNCNRVK